MADSVKEAPQHLNNERKVFVGNLSYNLTEDDLIKQFQEMKLTVQNCKILKRRDRSLGYGFVELSSPEECTRAINGLNNQTVNERQIRVQQALPPNPERRERDSFRGRGNGRGRGRGGRGRGGRGRGVGRVNEGRRRRISEDVASGSPTEGAAVTQRPNRNPNPTKTSSSNNAETNEQRPPRRFNNRRPRRAPRDTKDGIDSETSLFASNVSFSVTDSEFLDHFKSLGAISSKIIRMYNGASRGFGFVDFESKAGRDAAILALADANKATIKGRTITVKPSLVFKSAEAPSS